MRGLDVVASYGNVKCTVLTDKIGRSFLTSLANGYVNQIRKICQQGKWFIIMLSLLQHMNFIFDLEKQLEYHKRPHL